jgi:hypothetical protein
MKITFTAFLLLFSMGLVAQQGFCVTKNINPDKPAPCPIDGISQPVDVWLVQVGVYRRQVIPRPNTFVYGFADEVSIFYVYYINQNYTEEDARKAALYYQANGFCDAIAKPDPTNKIMFVEKNSKLAYNE